MAGWTGLEPAAFRVTGGRYNQLNYHPAMVIVQETNVIATPDLRINLKRGRRSAFFAQLVSISLKNPSDREKGRRYLFFMKTLIFVSLVFGSLIVSAETTTLQVQGMHCGGCKAAIEAKVCKIDGLKTCNVELVDKKKQIGKLVLTSADGTTLDLAKIEAALTEAGDYKLAQPAAGAAAATPSAKSKK